MENEPLIYIVPDVHGRKFWRFLKEHKTDKPIVFLGDYLDPYGFEGITPNDAINNFKEILQFKKDNPEQVTLLLGNHDCEYAISKRICYCRCDDENYPEIQDMFRNNWDWFKMVYEFENKGIKWLLSHAGINPNWMDNWSFAKKDIPMFNEWLNNKDSKFITSLESVSRFRGGCDYDGSPVWADIREYECKSKELMDNVGYDIQVCGHTYLNGSPLTFDSITCIDCQKVFYINGENELKEANELKEGEYVMEQENKDLCKNCKHFWLDFPMPLDHYVAHCEVLDDRGGGLLDDVVPYPCTKCPFDCYSKK